VATPVELASTPDTTPDRLTCILAKAKFVEFICRTAMPPRQRLQNWEESTKDSAHPWASKAGS
jgi:hypothetical protein